MAQDGNSEETTAPTAESQTEPEIGAKSKAEVPTAPAEREAPAAPGSADQLTGSEGVASAEGGEPVPAQTVDRTSPTGESAVPDDARRPQDSNPSIEVHGELDSEPIGLDEAQHELAVTEPKPPREPPPPKPPAEPTVTPSPAPLVVDRATEPKPARVSEAQPVAAARGGMSRFEKSVVVSVLLGIALAALVALAWPRKALLVVSAIGSSDQSLQNLKITVDGELKCERSPCPVGELSAGEHTVRVSSDEFGVAERPVAMRAGADHSLDFVLERPRQDLELARPIASAAFSAEPSAEAPPAEAQGRGAVAAARSGKPRGQGTGIIKANSIPVSEVLVDGRMAGQTPANISAAPGLHTVVFIHPDYGRREVVVQVKPNQDAVAAVRFRRSGP